MRRLPGAVALLMAAATAVVAQRGSNDATAPNATITAVPGIKVGHHTMSGRPTGCTVVLIEGGAVGGVSQRGGAPGTRETDLLDPLNLVDTVHAIVLAGGSAFGLDAASGTMRWLDEHEIGWPTSAGRVPIVPAAVLYDLGFGGRPDIRPDANCGYAAAAAATGDPAAEGTIGAGAGATVGKFRGGRPTKTGIGSAAILLPDGLVVGAIVAVNAVGDIVDPDTARVVAGARNADGSFADLRKLVRSGAPREPSRPGENTTIGVVATNAKLTKAQASRMALMADDGYARAVYPAHTIDDGDTFFAVATGRWEGEADISAVGALAAEAMARAVVRAGTQATGAAGVPAARDLQPR